jgi:hypothetical protein
VSDRGCHSIRVSAADPGAGPDLEVVAALLSELPGPWHEATPVERRAQRANRWAGTAALVLECNYPTVTRHSQFQGQTGHGTVSVMWDYDGRGRFHASYFVRAPDGTRSRFDLEATTTSLMLRLQERIRERSPWPTLASSMQSECLLAAESELGQPR